MQHQMTQLKNNLNTLFVDSPGTTAATVQIWFRAGSALEKKGDEGIAHFLEHMFFKGTEKRPGAAIAHEVESFGGEINAFTSFDYTCYYINTPNSQLIRTIDILLDMVSNPLFKMDDLIPERGVVFEEYRRSLDNPNHFSFHILQEKCFKNGYDHPILGSESTIKSFSVEQLINFRKNNYNLSNALLVVGGDLGQKEKIIETIEKYQLPKGPETKFPEFKISPVEVQDVHERDVRMGQLTFVWQAPLFEEAQSAPEDLAMNCLGHGETSRLYKALVQDSSVANNCSCSTMFMAKGGAHFVKIIFPIKNFKKVTDIVYKEIEKIKKERFGQLENQKIKNQYLSSKIYEMESVESYAFSLGHSFAQNGNFLSEEEFISKIKNTSHQEVSSAFNNILERPLHLFLQIPKGHDLEKKKAELKDFHKKFKTLNNIKINSDLESINIPGKKSKHDPLVRLISLKNGVSLIYRKKSLTPTFVLHAYLNGGLSFENLKSNGEYNLISALLTSGYGDISNDQLKQDLEDKSAMLNGFSGKNAYGMTLHGLSEHFPPLLQHFMGSILNPTFPEKYLEHEIEMCSRALENQKEDPVKYCFAEFSKIIFGKHAYSYNPIGTVQSLKNMNRKNLLKRHQNNLKTSQILFTYCGDMDYQDIIKLLDPYIEKFSPKTTKLKANPKITTQYGKNSFIEFNREQTQIMIGIKTFCVGHPDHIFLKILSTHLSGQSSELFVEVRDRQGLCYSAQPIHFLAKEAGYWGIYMASGHDKVERAIAAIKTILKKLSQEGLTKEEFNRVKLMLEGQSQINIQTNEDYANLYSVPVFQGGSIDFYYDTNKKINDLKYEVFQKKIKSILNQKWNQVVVGRK